MISKAEKIANKIIQGNQVVLYCAGAETLTLLNELQKKWNVKPTCLCDGDPGKWHNSLLGVQILPPDEAIAEFPDAYYYIVSRQYKYQILGHLLSVKNISPSQIIEYEEIEYRVSCIHLESSVVCTNNKLYFCCSDFGKNKSPYVEFNGDNNSTMCEFIAYRDKLISNLNNGILTPCDGCPYVKQDWYPSERKIRMYNDSQGGICNFNCCYCGSSAKTSTNHSSDLDALKLRDTFATNNLMVEDLLSVIACGEITVHPRRNDIYESISKFRNTVFTNASVFDKKLQALLELERTDLVVSVDAGTKSTYAKVKGLDLFDKVHENLKRYSSSGIVILKYIVLPGINDNKADIDGFIALCKDCKIELVTVSYDIFASPTLTEHTTEMVKYFIDQLSKSDIVYRVISDVISRALNEGQKAV